MGIIFNMVKDYTFLFKGGKFMDNFEKVEGEKLGEVAGGADTSRDEQIKKATEEFVSKLPPRHKVKIFCYKCRKSYDHWMYPGRFGGRVVCPKCGSGPIRIEDTDEVETKNEKTK